MGEPAMQIPFVDNIHFHHNMLFYSHHQSTSLFGLYAVIFLAGIARGFADPANSAFEAQVVPKNLTVNGASWIASTWIFCGVLGPAVIGFIFDAYKASGSYIAIGICF